jgi:magnesium transporter
MQKLLKEGLVGLLNGILLSLLIYGIAFVFASSTLGFVVSISLLVVVIFAAIIGTLIPLLLHKNNIDPALATGPFITTLNDVLGLFIYFTVGMLLYNL